ncbi:hypothetical protein EDC04DRAFT_2888452 [Pisolithus marmoratus]|nr:hypothetical protein EDC04DRAFT_2888452 [Pisolithus marmoratus]
MLLPHVSQTSLLPPLARRPIVKWLCFASISSTSSLSFIFATPPSSPSTLAPPTQSHPLECEIKTANKKITNLECDEIVLEAELQTLHDMDLGGVNLMCYVQRAMHCPYLIQECKHMFCLACLQWWFAECLHKDLECVDLPPHLEDRRDPPYTAETLEEFYAIGVAYAGLSYTCPFCCARVWEKPKEEQALTCAISSLAAALGPAVQTNTNDDVDSDVWAGIFL